jgi:hypothetical protein
MTKYILIIIALIVAGQNNGAFAQKKKKGAEDVSLLKLSFEQGNWAEVNRLYAANPASTDSTYIAIKNAYTILMDTTNKNTVKVANKLNPKCVTIDGSKSIDPANTNVTYMWNMPNGEVLEGVKITHCFADTGLQKVRLTFKDNSSDMEFADDTVLYIPISVPQANIIGGANQVVHSTKQYSIKSIYDGNATYVWDTNDDKYYTGNNIKVKYETEGTYKLRCYVKHTTDASKPVLIVSQMVNVGKYTVRGSTIITTVNEHFQDVTGTGTVVK